jgi:hypothetical protein
MPQYFSTDGRAHWLRCCHNAKGKLHAALHEDEKSHFPGKMASQAAASEGGS